MPQKYICICINTLRSVPESSEVNSLPPSSFIDFNLNYDLAKFVQKSWKLLNLLVHLSLMHNEYYFYLLNTKYENW